jgi:hypothetical protein
MGAQWQVIIGAVLIITGVAWFVGAALLVRTFAATITRNAAVIDLVTGMIFIMLGVVMVWQGLVGLTALIPG